jgi:predicted nucleotide-binding protein
MTAGADDWVTAAEAIAQLPHGARAICRNARAKLVKARARLLIWGGERRTGADIPSEFWWAEGGEALTQDWRTGDFETWLNHGSFRIQAFGVEFWRSDIEQLMPAQATNPAAGSAPKSSRRTVFVGHGHSQEWRKLYIFLRDQHDLSVIEFNSGSPAGISTTEHLQEMLNKADFAFVILTGEDEQATGELNPRLNVVHEAGLFQGKLGFRKAILLLEEGCQDFSNVRGLTHIPFPKGKIETQFHQATSVLKREKLIS